MNLTRRQFLELLGGVAAVSFLPAFRGFPMPEPDPVIEIHTEQYEVVVNPFGQGSLHRGLVVTEDEKMGKYWATAWPSGDPTPELVRELRKQIEESFLKGHNMKVRWNGVLEV